MNRFDFNISYLFPDVFLFPEIAGPLTSTVDFRISLSAVSLMFCRLDAQEWQTLDVGQVDMDVNYLTDLVYAKICRWRTSKVVPRAGLVEVVAEIMIATDDY